MRLLKIPIPSKLRMDTIYLDHNATTPVRAEVIEAMSRCLAEGYGNPSSQHRPGQRARKVLEDARERIAEILGADLTCPQPDRLIFTSGGTEANNLAVLGLPRHVGGAGNRIAISAIEHQSVIEPAEHLLENGWELDTLPVTQNGVVRLDALESILRPQTRLVSVLLGNHEVGTVQPCEEIAAHCRSLGVPFHTDAIQAAGKIAISFRHQGFDALSIAAHKFQGPLGVGALILGPEVKIRPQLFGGHQQSGVRPGTESVALAVGMLTALELWNAEQAAHYERLREIRDRFERGLKAALTDAIVHAEQADRLPQTSNVAFPGLDGQVLLMALDMAGVACSVGSACSSGSSELSPTLLAMDVSQAVAASSLRFSFGATNTAEEIDEAVARIARVCREIA